MSVIKGYPLTNSSPTDAQIITVAKDVNSAKMALNVSPLGDLVPRNFDHITLAYTGSNLTTVTYRVGGTGGTTVAVLTLGYTGANLTTVSRSLP